MLGKQNQNPNTFNAQQVEKLVQGKCICQACNCGKHHCPAPHHKGYYQSSYVQSYPKHDAKPNTYQRQKNTIPESQYSPNDILSAYLSNFKQPAESTFLDSNKYKNVHKNFIFPTDNFKGQSSYSDAYRNKKYNTIDLTAPMPKNNHIQQKHCFEGISCYQNDYVIKNAQRPQKFIIKNNLGVSDQKFDGQTSYVSDFQNRGGQHIQKYIQKGQLQLSNSRFQGSSNYSNDYNNKGTTTRTLKVSMIKNHILPQGKFEGNSTYNQNYISGKVEKNKQKQYRPNDEIKIGGVFQGQSSYLGDYTNAGPPVKAQRAPQIKNYIMPQGQFQGDSTYNANFISSKIQKHQQFRPQEQLKLGGLFEGISSYSKDYPNQEPLLEPKGRNKQKIKLYHSTYRSNYLGANSQQNLFFRPQQQLKVGGKFQGSSSYEIDYKMIQSPSKIICPTDILKAPRYHSGDKEHLKYNANNHNWQ